MPTRTTRAGIPELLMNKAVDLFDSRFFEASIVTAQTACETCCEQVLSRHLREAAHHLESPVHALLGKYNIADKRVRDLYVALTGCKIQDESFWRTFVEMTQHRNRVVHAGDVVTEEDAERYLETARHVLAYMGEQQQSA